MKRFISSMMLTTLVVCAVASMMMQPAKAEIIVFTAQLLPGNETPPVTNADANASGSVIVTLDTGNNTARFDVSVNGLGSSNVILAHIHEGPAGVAGPIRVDSGITPPGLTVVNGSVAFTRSGLTVPADVAQRLVANPAGFYFNVHTNLNPGGAVRGQLVRAQAAGGGTSAPTLSQWGMMLMMLLMLAAGTFFLVARRPVATAESAIIGAVSGSAINWPRFARVALVVELVIAVALLAWSASPVDVMGALASGLIVAYIIQLLMGAARKD
jgi:hypothetical protein